MQKEEIEWTEVHTVAESEKDGKFFVTNLPTQEGFYFAQIAGEHGTKRIQALKDGSGNVHFLVIGGFEIEGRFIIRWRPEGK